MPAPTDEEKAILHSSEEGIIVKDLALPPEYLDSMPKDKKTAPPQDNTSQPPAKGEESDPLFSLPDESAISTILSEDEAKPGDIFTNEVRIQGLNKITAKTEDFTAVLDKPVAFGSLEITLKRCWKSPPDESPENKALLEVWEQKPGEEKQRIFYGWMFSSTPAVSALEHPVYDMIVLSCVQEPVVAPGQ